MRNVDDPLFQTIHRFVIYNGKDQLGGVYVLSERFIFAPKKARHGLRCVKVVGY
ncbi:hypothetical protein PM3016_1448 [Paenibacillus mucilaginosus 3016]|uniref:Uncharacterized protein n=1 Tax=Paenibacillus mucilaginosus 3016 TaxID=1116391 RepID=H6NGT1_9BACL|nr:hypothetical protein [Paenibacillus mucilaginosus]AFC28373.1 hypothetical protein PM3016_1448 [Paenibacillus mucilaginosus 3016]